MVLPDVNVVLQALRPDFPEHDVCRRWLEHATNKPERFGMSPQVLSSVIRIVTNPKVLRSPSPVGDVIEACDTLLSRPNCVAITPGDDHWGIFTRLCRDANVRGNLVPDAWFAALAIESGCEWVTLDNHFSRFSGLRWRRPIL